MIISTSSWPASVFLPLLPRESLSKSNRCQPFKMWVQSWHSSPSNCPMTTHLGIKNRVLTKISKTLVIQLPIFPFAQNWSNFNFLPGPLHSNSYTRFLTVTWTHHTHSYIKAFVLVIASYSIFPSENIIIWSCRQDLAYDLDQSLRVRTAVLQRKLIYSMQKVGSW